MRHDTFGPGAVPLAMASLVLAVGVVLTEVRMEGPWSHGALLVVVAVPFLVTQVLALSVPRVAEGPTQGGSILLALGFAYASVTVYRIAQVLGADDPASAAGTLTWEWALLTAVAAAGAVTKRSAGMALLAALSLGVVANSGVIWIFDLDNGLRTARYVLLALAVAYALAGVAAATRPPVGAAFFVASGFALLALALTLTPILLVDLGSEGHVAFGWELATALGGLILVGAAARDSAPGPGWLAGFVLAGFVFEAVGHERHPSLFGWPLALLVLGGLGTLSALWSASRRSPA